MPDVRYFPKGGMKTEHDAILKSIGTYEHIIVSFSRLPSTTNSYFLPCSSLSSSQN